MQIDKNKVFEKEQKSIFINDLVPNMMLSNSKNFMKEINKINQRLLQKNEGTLKKLSKILDKTVLEF